MNFLPHLPYFLTSLGEIWYQQYLLNAVEQYESFKNKNNERHTLLKGINKFPYVLSYLLSNLGAIWYR